MLWRAYQNISHSQREETQWGKKMYYYGFENLEIEGHKKVKEINTLEEQNQTFFQFGKIKIKVVSNREKKKKKIVGV